MINRSVFWIASTLDASVHNLIDPSCSVQGVSTDSRKIMPGMLYVPLIGARSDGHEYIQQVIDAGAGASLWQKDHLPYPKGIPLIVVDNPLEGLQQLARAYLAELSCLTIGVTGSNGKTSVKDLTASVLSQTMKTQKTQGNHNNEIGMPLTILDLDEDVQAAVLEMGMENYGEIAFLCSLAPLDVAVITTIGSAHMENFGSRLNIAKAKCEILQGLKPGGTFIYNADALEIEEVLATCELDPTWKVLSYGQNGKTRLADDVRFDAYGMSFQLPQIDEKPFFVGALGAFQAWNATAALLVGQTLGVELEKIRAGLARPEMTRMRGQIYPCRQARILDDTYKSNPESACAAMEMLMDIPAQMHIAVLADMLDLGEEELALHEMVGQKARALGVDALLTWGDRSKATAAGYGAEGMHFDDFDEMIQAISLFLDRDAVILVKGSRAMAMDRVVDTLLERR